MKNSGSVTCDNTLYFGSSVALLMIALTGGVMAPGGPLAHPIRLALVGIGLALTGVAWSGCITRREAVAGTQSGQAHRRKVLLALTATLFLMLLFAGVWEALQVPVLRAADEYAVHRFYRSGGKAVTRWMRKVSGVGGRDLLVLVVPALLGALVVLRKKPLAWFLGSAMFGTFGLEVLFKTLVHRQRPNLVKGVHFDSFPSGHALAATILAGCLLVILLPACRSRFQRGLLGVALPVWPLLIAASRVYLGRHYVTDVLAGIMLGAAWVCLCYAFWTGVATVPPAVIDTVPVLRRDGPS